MMSDHQSEGSLRYYENLRRGDEVYDYESGPGGSKIYRVKLPNQDDIRLMHLVQIMSILPTSPFVYLDASSLLALKHFNERSNAVIPSLSKKLEGCNLYITMDMLNPALDSVLASTKLYSYFNKKNATLQSPYPAAVIGGTLSRISLPLAVLTGAYEIPQISPASQSILLDHDDIAPFFGRTLPTNRGVAQVVVEYLDRLSVSHFGMLYQRDDFGTSSNSAFLEAALERNTTMISIGYDEIGTYDSSDTYSLDRALKFLKESGVRYIYGTMHTASYEEVLVHAYDQGLIGHDYVWLVPDVIVEPRISLDRKNQPKLLTALQGVLQVGLWNREHAAFEGSLVNSLQNDPDFLSFFLESHRGDETVYEGINIAEAFPIVTQYSYFAYDAAMTLGIAACQTSNDKLFTGPEFLDEIRQTTFDSVSGHVKFDTETGTRDHKTASYSITNFFVDEASSDKDNAVFIARKSTIVSLNSREAIHDLYPIIYNDGSSTPPPTLPVIVEDMNLVPLGVFVFGWICLVMLLLAFSALAWWVCKHRSNQSVRASQPFFLWILLLGTSIQATAIIPMSFQEPMSQRSLDIACMATPFLFVFGLAVSLSAMFAKALRLSLVVREAMDMRRTAISPRNVMLPFATVLSMNVLLLTLWTATAPLTYTRVRVANLDPFGRSLESYGTCLFGLRGGESSSLAVLYVTLLVVINVVLLVAIFCQAYSKRNMPTLFNESSNLCLCAACMLEVLILGVPVLAVAGGDPTAFYLVRTLVTVGFCIAYVGPIFVPLLWSTRLQDLTMEEVQQEWRSYISQETSGDGAVGGGGGSSRQFCNRLFPIREQSSEDQRSSDSPSTVTHLRNQVSERLAKRSGNSVEREQFKRKYREGDTM